MQLGKLGAIVSERKRQARRYDEALAEIEEIEPPYVPPWAEHAYSSYCIRLRSARLTAHEAVLAMAERGISCRHGIQPLHLEPYFRASMQGLCLPESERAARETLFLPIFPGLTEDQQTKVIAELTSIVTAARRTVG